MPMVANNVFYGFGDVAKVRLTSLIKKVVDRNETRDRVPFACACLVDIEYRGSL